MILKPTPEMPEQAHRPGNGSSILNSFMILTSTYLPVWVRSWSTLTYCLSLAGIHFLSLGLEEHSI